MDKKKRTSKYTPEKLIKLFRGASKFRSQCVEKGLEDNMGAIHSAERALHLLGPIIVYPGMGHLNTFAKYPQAKFSTKALKAYASGEKVRIEHVQPHRAFTLRAMDQLKLTDKQFIEFIRRNFRLVLLTPEETKHLNGINKSRIDRRRLQKAGIELASHKVADKVLSRGRPKK